MKDFYLMVNGFDEAAAKDLVNAYVSPITNFLMWVIIPIGIIAALGVAISFYQKEEQERDLNRFRKMLTTIFIVAIVAESLTILFKIFGLGT